MNPATTNLIDELCAQVERAWLDQGDLLLVDRLAGEHPELAGELYDFSSALVDSAYETSIPDELARQAARRTRALLEDEGLERSARAARHMPGTFIRFLRERSAAHPEEIVRRVGGVSWEFLVMVSRYPALVPAAAANQLVKRISKALGIPAQECLARLKSSGLAPTAASRSLPYPPEPTSFADLLERGALGEKELAYWRRFTT